LERRKICRPGHNATESVDLAHHSTFRHPADRRIAGHLADGLERARNEANRGSEACRRDGCLGAGMARTDDNNVKSLFEITVDHHGPKLCLTSRRRQWNGRQQGHELPPVAKMQHRSTDRLPEMRNAARGITQRANPADPQARL
jgi:hypothetical protein